MDIRINRPNDHVHPLIYKALIGLALWFILTIWLGFGGYSYTDYLLAIVTGLFSFPSCCLPLCGGFGEAITKLTVARLSNHSGAGQRATSIFGRIARRELSQRSKFSCRSQLSPLE
jgi:hypothetical protein